MSVTKFGGLLILGTGGHSRVLIEAAISSGEEILGLVDTDYTNQKETILGIDVLGGVEILAEYFPKEIFVAIAIGDNLKRVEWYIKLRSMGFKIATIIHSTAIISKTADIGKGSFINSGAIINADATIGNNCIINTGTIVEHEVKIGSHCHLAPGVRVGGRTSIERNAFVGIGTSIADYIKIGKDVTIGAGSVIVKDIKSGDTVVGLGRVLK